MTLYFLFSPSSQKIQDKKPTQPWWPLLPSYYYAAVCDTDMAGGEHHHRWPYHANMTDDLPPPSWLAHKNTSKMVHPPMTSKYSAPTTCIEVHRIINIRLLWRCHRISWPIYMCSRLGGTLLANLAPPIQPKLTYIWYAWNRILFPPPRALIWIPTSLLPVIGHIIYMIYVQHSWIGICQWYDQYRWKWGIYYWFGMYITINYIAIMMGESIDSTIY